MSSTFSSLAPRGSGHHDADRGDHYLDTRLAEGAPRSALKCFKVSLAFFEQATGVEEKDKLSTKPLVVNGYKEVLLRAAQPWSDSS